MNDISIERRENYCKEEIERLFGSVDPECYSAAWFEYDSPAGKRRRTFVTYAIRANYPVDATQALIRALRHDCRKQEGHGVVTIDENGMNKKNCRMAWRTYPYIHQDDEDGYIASCRLVWWLASEDEVDSFMKVA